MAIWWRRIVQRYNGTMAQLNNDSCVNITDASMDRCVDASEDAHKIYWPPRFSIEGRWAKAWVKFL